MGVIKRQVIKSNILSFAAVIIGVLSHLFVYTLDLETKGFADAIFKYSRLLMTFLVLGSTSVMIRFLPYADLSRKEAARSLFTRSLLVVTGTVGLAALLLLIFGEEGLAQVASYSSIELGYLTTEPWLILVITALFAYALVFTTNLANHQRIAIPVLFNNFLPKLLVPALLLVTVFYHLDRQEFAVGMVAIYLLSVLGLWGYTRFLKHHTFSLAPLKLTPERRKQLFSLAGFAVIGTLGSALATSIDTIFVSSYLGDVQTGVYSFAIYATTVMTIPSLAVKSICGPIVAEAYKKQDTAHISFLYRESAKILFAWGGIIYVGGLLCLPHLFELTSRTGQLTAAFTVFALLGAGQLFDLATSINSTIVSNSDYFRWNTTFIIFLGVFNVILDYKFIVLEGWGINGAAMATCFSLLAFNVAKIILIKYKMGFQPLGRSIGLTTIVLVGIYFLVVSIPEIGSPITEVLVRGSAAVVLYFVYLRFTNGVPPLRRFLLGGKNDLFKK